MTRKMDLLCIGPHPDDAEIGFGATLRLLAEQGRRVWVCDLTRGELGSNATPDERWFEAQQAARVLKLEGRVQLDLPDGFVDPSAESQLGAVVDIIRRLQPRWVVTAPDARRHPDHRATPVLVRKAVFLSHLATYRPDAAESRCWQDGAPLPEAAAAHTCEAVFGVCSIGAEPSMIFDCTSTWPAKLEAIACFDSQFRRDGERRDTAINDPAFGQRIDRRGRHWGGLAGVSFAEAIVGETAPLVDDLPDMKWVGR